MYNMITRHVEERATPPHCLQLCASASCNGCVYSLGGWIEASTQLPISDVCAYNPDTDSWVTGPSLPAAVHGMAASEHGVR